MRPQLRKLVKSYSGAFDIMQGESGCPSQLEYAHAMPDIKWTEYSQAKWAVDRDVWFEMVQRFDSRDTSTRKMSAARFTRYGSTIRFFWFSDSRPSDTLGFDRATVWMRPEGLSHPVWVEMITGRVFEIPEKDIRREKDRLLITALASRWSR